MENNLRTTYFILSFNSGWISIPYFFLSLLSVALDISCSSFTSRVEPRIRPALQLRPHPYPVKQNSCLLCPYTTLIWIQPTAAVSFFATTLPIHSYSCVIHPNCQMLFCSAIAKLFPACTHAFHFLSFVCAEFHLTDLALSFDLIPKVSATSDSFGRTEPTLSFLCLPLSSPVGPCLSSYRPSGKWRVVKRNAAQVWHRFNPLVRALDQTLNPKSTRRCMGQAKLREWVNLLHRLEQVHQALAGSPSWSST